jgi:predicted nucleic acid-binding protein
VPSLCLYEVYHRLRSQRDEPVALEVIGAMMEGRVVDLDASLALMSARTGLATGLSLADSVILATARAHEATLWTQDADFEGMEGVRYFERGSHGSA